MKIRTSLNIEATNVCNARCITCPRPENQGYMSLETHFQLIDRMYEERDCITIANWSGYGETILHPNFFEIIEQIKGLNQDLSLANKKSLACAVVSNGYALNREKLESMEGILDRLSISFASISRENYESIHKGLNYDTTVSNIKLAREVLKKTRLVIHLTPTNITDEKDIEETVGYWRNYGVQEFVLFPMTSNRGGLLGDENLQRLDSATNIELAKRLKISHLESVFKPAPKELLWLLYKKLFEKDYCIPGIASISIDYKGNYRHCINDINSKKIIGNLKDMSISQALEQRLKSNSSPICNECNIKDKIFLKELFKKWFRV